MKYLNKTEKCEILIYELHMLKEEQEINKQANSQSKFVIKTFIIQAHPQQLSK